ncbi:hypothetical protein NHX12_023573 [Muraenolepis orangiensis]|uniref:Ig-like domain-containing protein n=1 Tax=Muraenolepis orangiensis TaxID=630683 RepID=A0A9Q0ENC5_9TELE|nr:hypothetical protein NHX12_023573 [Muraenolepis orangiensis]
MSLLWCVSVLPGVSVLLGSALGSPRAGQNFSVPCELPHNVLEVTWFHLYGDSLMPLLSASLNKFNKTVERRYSERRFHLRGDLVDPPVSLEMRAVNQTDAGLYYCVGRYSNGSLSTDALRLTVGGKA